jgi:hypothetical protein
MMSRYALDLDGYDDYSVWGFDELDATYFAQLWRNDSDSRDDPDIWLSGFAEGRPVSDPLGLAELVGHRTGRHPAEVLRAMAAGCGSAEADRLTELARRLAAPAS